MKYKTHEYDYADLRKTIQQNHILSLPQQKSTLIADWNEHLIDDSKKIIKSTPLIYTDILDKRDFKEWNWTFDTRKKYRSEGNTNFAVRAMSL